MPTGQNDGDACAEDVRGIGDDGGVSDFDAWHVSDGVPWTRREGANGKP